MLMHNTEIELKKVLFLIIPLLILFLYGGCGDNGNNPLICSVDDFIESMADAECLSEELVERCINAACFAEAPQISSVNLDGNCSQIDCENLTCDRIVIRSGNTSTPFPGNLLELSIDPDSGFPIGVVQVDEIESDITCSVFVQ